jgi:hypothetical protein
VDDDRITRPDCVAVNEKLELFEHAARRQRELLGNCRREPRRAQVEQRERSNEDGIATKRALQVDRELRRVEARGSETNGGPARPVEVFVARRCG